jgi:hypothetical protein
MTTGRINQVTIFVHQPNQHEQRSCKACEGGGGQQPERPEPAPAEYFVTKSWLKGRKDRGQTPPNEPSQPPGRSHSRASDIIILLPFQVFSHQRSAEQIPYNTARDGKGSCRIHRYEGAFLSTITSTE